MNLGSIETIEEDKGEMDDIFKKTIMETGDSAL